MADLETLLAAALKRHLAGQPAELTAGLAPLWAAFCDLSATRPATPAGPGPIPFAEIEVWSRLTRCPLEPHHVRCLRVLDETFLDHCRRRLALGAGREIADVPLSLGAFDARFG